MAKVRVVATPIPMLVMTFRIISIISHSFIDRKVELNVIINVMAKTRLSLGQISNNRLFCLANEKDGFVFLFSIL
jgi:hypothetical protein